MRDYKNVKVPRSYRSDARRTSVKAVHAGGTSARSQKSNAGIMGLLFKVAAVVLIGGGVVLAWQGYRATIRADVFIVSGVDVKGAKQLNENDLKEIAGVFKGQNIFRADIDAAVRRARANPWVKEARVYRRLPNRISMVVRERVPSFILDTGADRFLMDDEGVVIERFPKEGASAWQLPVVAIRG